MDRIVSILIAKKDFAFKSLRQGESIPESSAPKLLEDLLQRDKALFLERYARFMDQDELSLFSKYAADDYEVRWHLSQHLNVAPPSAKVIRNRRYRLQQGLIDPMYLYVARYKYLKDCMGPDYFDDDAVKDREPVLFHEFIGRHLTEQEKKAPFPSAMRLVDRMYYDIDSARYEAEANVGGLEEEYESESDLEEDAGESVIQEPLEVTPGQDEGEGPKLTKAEERESFLFAQRTELCRIITERFLSGLDATFDYSAIDGDPTFDDLVLESQRLSDAYFDEEDPST